MPRPAAKRSRLNAKPPQSVMKQNCLQEKAIKDSESTNTDILKSPASDTTGTSRLVNSAHPSEIVRQLRNQTPQEKAHEFAIESSPTGELIATGSRPPTRARGYSSTLSLIGRKGDISSKIPGTPAFESSVLSNFRRRPRQASILQMMQDGDGSSDFDDDDFLGGLSPEDESTPLNLSRGKSLVIRTAMPSSPINSSFPPSGKSSKRKQSITELPAPQSPLDKGGESHNSPFADNRDGEPSRSVDLLRAVGSSQALSEAMVPPMSSPPPEPSGATLISGHVPQPSTGENGLRNRAIECKIHIPTAALQDKFLPRRRQRQRVRYHGPSFEVPSDSDEDLAHSAAPDDDELTYLPYRKPSQYRRKRTNKAKGLPTRQETAKMVRVRQRGEAEIERKKHGPGPRQPSADKENELRDMSSPLSSALDTDELDSDFESHPVTHFLSEELRLQAMKFAEVDKWQMEFEDVITSVTQGNNMFR